MARKPTSLTPDSNWLRDVIAAANEFAVISMDAEGRIVTWNPGAERLFVHREEDVRGQPASLIFTPEDVVTGAYAREMRIAATEGCAKDDRWHVRRDSSRMWASGLLMAMRGDDGMVRGFVKVIQDKTDDKRLEDDLRASEEQFARVFLGNPAAMVVERRDTGAFVLANESFFQLTGYWRSDVMGRSADELSLWAEPSGRGRALKEIEAGAPASIARVSLRSKSGDVRACAATFSFTQLSEHHCILGAFIPLPSGD